MSQAITPAMREIQMAVYEGGQDAGMQLPGRSDWGEFNEALAGSQRDPLQHWTTPDTTGTPIGMSGEMTVAVGAEGQLVNQARHRAPDDAPSTHLLKIDVRPTVVFGEDGNVPIIRWIANATVFKLSSEHVVVSTSSADDEAERALAGDRPTDVYMNDPEYQAALPGLVHETPRDAVRAALEKISSGGRINLPDTPDPATSAPIAATPAPATAAPEADSGGPSWLLPLLGVAGVGAIIIVLLALFAGGDDSEPDLIVAPTATVTSTSVTADEPSEPSIVVPEPPVVSATTSTTSSTTTTTTEVIDATTFEILDSRCINRATAEAAEGCSTVSGITRSGVGPSTLFIGLDEDLDSATEVTVSLSLSGDPGNDLLLECDWQGECQTWVAPSFFSITTQWMPVRFDSAGEIGFIFDVIDRGDGSAALSAPAVESTNGDQNAAGEYTVTQGVIYVERDGLQSTTLFGDGTTFWFTANA